MSFSVMWFTLLSSCERLWSCCLCRRRSECVFLFVCAFKSLFECVCVCVYVCVRVCVSHAHPSCVSSSAIRAHRGRADGPPASQPLQRAVRERHGGVPQERGEEATGPQRYDTHSHTHSHTHTHCVNTLKETHSGPFIHEFSEPCVLDYKLVHAQLVNSTRAQSH